MGERHKKLRENKKHFYAQPFYNQIHHTILIVIEFLSGLTDNSLFNLNYYETIFLY